jgi:hypothetical protein
MKSGGLQLAWNDKAAASGLMTQARQDRSPAACAASAAYVKHFTLATLPASNAGMFGWEGAICKPFAPSGDGVPKHRSSLPQTERAALTPCLKAGASAPEKVNWSVNDEHEPEPDEPSQ